MILEIPTPIRNVAQPLWLVLLVLLTLRTNVQGQASPEVWTNIDGREMTATLLQATDTHAEFRLQNGKRARLKLDQLIEEDRSRAQNFLSRVAFWKSIPTNARWPARVTINWM